MESKKSSRSPLSLKVKSSSRKVGARERDSELINSGRASTSKNFSLLNGPKTPDNKNTPSLYKEVLTINAKNVLHNSTPQRIADKTDFAVSAQQSYSESANPVTSMNESYGNSSTKRQRRDSSEFHCSFEESDEENMAYDIPATQPVPPDEILQGVTAYIEVRSNSENRFEGISKKMKALGATVTKKFTADVTHVVFKDGKSSTREKALKKGIHLVSVLWVESCRVGCKRVSEDLFPVITPDNNLTPLVVGRLKRTKSMQPKAFEEDVKNSAERGKRKRRRKVLEEQRGTPASKILVQDTQAPFSPIMIGPSPSLHLVPDTPTRPDDHYSTASETNSDTESISKEVTSKRLDFDDEKTKSKGTRRTAKVRKTALSKKPKQQQTDTECTTTTKKRKRRLLAKSDKSTPSQEETPVVDSSVPRDVLLTGSGAFKRKKNNSSSDSEDTKKLKNKKKARITGDLVNKRSGDESGRVGENRTQSMSSEYGNSSAGENINNTGSLPKKEKKTVWNQRKKKQKRETSRSQPPAKDLDDGTDCSLDSGVSIDGSSSKLLQDTHNIPEAEKQKKKKFKRTIKALAENKSSTEEESTEEEEVHVVNEDVKRENTKTLSKMEKRGASKVKPKHSIVMTSMHLGEQDIVISVVRKLGGFYIADRVCPSTTHVISGSSRRTLNVLMAIAQGSWLVSSEWAMKSLEVGYWVDEEPYELHDDFPSAQLCRLERANSGPEYRQELFTECPLMFISENTSPPPDALMALITRCGGRISTSVRKAGICVGPVSRRTQGINVTERWILDSITEHAVLPFIAYALNSPAKRKQTSPSY